MVEFLTVTCRWGSSDILFRNLRCRGQHHFTTSGQKDQLQMILKLDLFLTAIAIHNSFTLVHRLARFQIRARAQTH